MEDVNLSTVTPAAEDDGTPGCIITTATSSMFVSNSFLLHDLQLWSLPSLWQDVIRHITPPPVLLRGLARPRWQQLTLLMQLDAHWLDLLLVLHASRPQQRRGGLIRRRSGRSVWGDLMVTEDRWDADTLKLTAETLKQDARDVFSNVFYLRRKHWSQKVPGRQYQDIQVLVWFYDLGLLFLKTRTT